jgi:membrane protease YdiL (CAAX protease family)
LRIADCGFFHKRHQNRAPQSAIFNPQSANDDQGDIMTDEAITPKNKSGIASIPWDYFALAYAISWALWGAAWLATRGRPPVEGSTEDLLAAAPPAFLVLVLLGVFGPFTSAFVLTWRRDGRSGAKALWKSGWTFKMPIVWWAVALLLFPALWAASLVISGAGVSFEPFANPLLLVGLTLFMYFLGGPFGEEFGWRGYALPRLLDGWSALGASVILGLFWAFWHLPLFFIPGSPQAQMPLWPFVASTTAMAVVFTWLHVHVGGIVFAAILFHTTGNLARNLFTAAGEAGEGWSSPDGIDTLLVIGLAVVVTLVWGPKKLRRE